MCKGEARRGFNCWNRAWRQASDHSGFWDRVDDVVRSIRCHFRLRDVRRALKRLPDHMLKDIGISRGEIDMIAAAKDDV